MQSATPGGIGSTIGEDVSSPEPGPRPAPEAYPPSPDPRLLIEESEKLSAGGDGAGSERLLREAVEVAAAAGDRQAQADALLRLAGNATGAGRVDEARAMLHQAVELASSVGDDATASAAQQLLETLSTARRPGVKDGSPSAGLTVTESVAATEAGRAAKAAAESPAEAAAGPDRREEVVAGFTGDQPDASNRLGRADRDVEVMAALIASDQLEPPLAIGVFGEWGAGKSSFLRQLAGRVGQYEGQDGFKQKIKQVEFNAWHYAETELMASLLYEVWTQTADEGLALAMRQDSLAEQLQEARSQRERLRDTQAAQALPRATAAVATQAGLGDLRLGDLPTELEGVKYVRNGLRRIPGWIWLLAAVAGVAVALLAVKGSDVAAAVAGVAAVWAVVERVRRSFRELGALSREQRQALEPLDRRIAELEREQAQIHRAADAGPGSSAAGVDELILQFKQSPELRGRLGITATAYEQLKPLSDRLRDSDTRIVLYVDDLDRCDPDRVVAVLETVHLLLALPAFVVVVAVDPRWLENSLMKKYAGLLDVDPAARQGQIGTPVEYLEKIFQIPYHVPSYTDSTDFEQFVTYLTARAPVRRSPGRAPGSAPAQPAPGSTSVADPAGAPGPGGVPAAPPPQSVPQVSAAALEIGPAERQVIVAVMPFLRTPRNGVRLVNLYRLVRAAVDPSGQGSDVLLSAACILLLALQIGFPGTARAMLDRAVAADPADPFWTAVGADEDVQRLFAAVQSVPAFTDPPLTCGVAQRCVPVIRRFSFHNPPRPRTQATGGSATAGHDQVSTPGDR